MNTDDETKCFEPGAKEKVPLVSSESTTESPSFLVRADTNPLLAADAATVNEEILAVEDNKFLQKSAASTNETSSLQNPQYSSPEIESNKKDEKTCLTSSANHDQNDEESPEVPRSKDSNEFPTFCNFLKNNKVTLALLCLFFLIGISIGYVASRATSRISNAIARPGRKSFPSTMVSTVTILIQFILLCYACQWIFILLTSNI